MKQDGLLKTEIINYIVHVEFFAQNKRNVYSLYLIFIFQLNNIHVDIHVLNTSCA